MIIAITPLYAAILALMFILLSLRVILLRREVRVALGDGGNSQLLRRQRVQGNFAEYVPFALVLMALAELQGAAAWTLHLIGVALLVGRIAHAAGVSRTPEPYRLRVAGMGLTFAALSIAAAANLVAAI